jgi:heterodisulfide reductase subunit D
MKIEDYRDMIYRCGRCNFCRGFDFNERCPEIFNQKWESSTARGRMAIARAILEGELEYSEELAERIFGCFLCARCEEECKKAAQINILDITKAMREDFVSLGISIPDAANQMADLAVDSGNIFGDTASVHTKWAQDLQFKEGSGTLFFPGCLASHRFKEKTRILVQLLQAAGYELDFLGEDQSCCGAPLWITGKMENARNLVQVQFNKLQAKGVKEIITPCPSCFRAFDEEYPKLLELETFPIKVTHTSVVLADIVDNKKLELKNPVNKRITYHDPCEIGRYREIYEPPRKALAAIPGIELVEMSRNRENSFCCGGGGGVKLTYPDYSQKVSRERLNDVLKTEAEIISTICPACELNLTHATYEADVAIRVLDIAEIMAVSAGVAEAEILDADYFPED